MQNYTEVSKCRVCSCSDLFEVLDLNKQPLANDYHKGEEKETFPLKINACKECFHVQLSVVVDPDLMFKEYLYVSGTSKTLHEYFERFVTICEEYSQGTGKVLDIACNDGTQLDKFKQKGWDTYGVDPAENLYKLSKDNHNIKCEYWNKDVAKSFGEKFDVITAQNVFAHVDDVQGFLSACFEVSQQNGLVLIQTSQADMIIDNQFDTIYHEHLSFFNSKSMKKCANLNGFSLIDVRKEPIHGGSYVFVLKKGEHDEVLASQEIEKEASYGLFTQDKYKEYAKNCMKVVSDFKRKVSHYKSEGFRIVGYGAAAKGNTFLNFADMDLDYIVDDNPLKQGLQTPGMDIPIHSPSKLKEEDHSRLIVVPLAWNFFKEIRERANEICGSNLTFIKYFPSLEVVE